MKGNGGTAMTTQIWKPRLVRRLKGSPRARAGRNSPHFESAPSICRLIVG